MNRLTTILAILVFCIAVNQKGNAQYANFVGEWVHINEPSAPGNASITWTQWHSPSPYLDVIGSSVYIKSYFSGMETVSCWYQYSALIDNRIVTHTATANYTITCLKRSVSRVSIPTSFYIYAGESQQLTATIEPYNAEPYVENTKWELAKGNEYVSLQGKTITGLQPGGSAEVYCTVEDVSNNRTKSNTATVFVMEPSFTLQSTSPMNDEVGVALNATPSVSFSHRAYKGDNFQDITLTNADDGTAVDGTASTTGNTLVFTPSQPLENEAKYTLYVPERAVKNQWGTHYTYAVTVDFYVGNCLWLKASRESGFVERGSTVTLETNLSTASIYYTTDGTTPTVSSNLYTGAITIDKEMNLRAIAMADGYRQSKVLAVDFGISNAKVKRFFPIDEQPLFLYHDMIPQVIYSNKIEYSTNIDKIKLKKNGETLKYEAIVADSTLFIVPDEPLQLGCLYLVEVPNDALRTWQGEICKATSWTFVTGNYVTAISTGGPELCTAIKTDGSLWTWGRLITEANTEDGSYSYTTQAEPSRFIDSEVIAVSSGYMHHAIVKRDGSLWMWGRQLCGEFGNGTTTASALPVKIMNDVKSVSCGLQTTAIVKTDGTLWMCGRNDLGQIDDSQMVKKQFVKVSEGVHDATLNWGSLVIVKTDGTTETRIWDMKADEQRKPTEKSSITTEFAVLEYGWKNALGLGEDGSVWAWNESSLEDRPTKLMEGRVSSELEGLTAITSTATIDAGKRIVLTAIPTPLNANYAKMMWSSSNSDVAEVSSRGVVTGISKGKTTVTAEISTDNGRGFSRTFSVIVEEGNLLKGDANIDGIVDGKDILEISRYIMKLQPNHFNKAAADANSDGIINIKDIVEIVNVIKQ